MEGFKLLFWAVVDWCYAILYDRAQRWELDCPHCDETAHSRSYNMVLLKDSLHYHFTGDGQHIEGDDGEHEQIRGRSDGPELVAGTTHLLEEQYDA